MVLPSHAWHPLFVSCFECWRVAAARLSEAKAQPGCNGKQSRVCWVAVQELPACWLDALCVTIAPWRCLVAADCSVMERWAWPSGPGGPQLVCRLLERCCTERAELEMVIAQQYSQAPNCWAQLNRCLKPAQGSEVAGRRP